MKNQKTKQANKLLNILLWIGQYLLAVIFIMAGTMKATQPLEDMASLMTWVNHVAPVLVRFIGLTEVLGALGLLIPSVLQIKPILTVWAAIGLIIIMIFAAIFHISIGELNLIGITLILAAVAAFIAWGRYNKVPIHSK